MGDIRQKDTVCVVLDIGKSFAKVSLINHEGKILSERRVVTPRLHAHLYAAYDVDRLHSWFLGQLRELSVRYDIDRIVPVTHGATCAFLSEDGQLLQPIQDYEAAIPQLYREAYNAIRPHFSHTLSPSLPNGLNMGCQIYWHARRDPKFFERVRWILSYPQYWTWRLSGALTTEVTSMGCHTDLWAPLQKTYSSMAIRQGWVERFPELKNAWDEAGPLRPDIADATGLSRDCKVLVGLHDTNAALASVIVRQHRDPSFIPPAMLSTGTWFIALAPETSVSDLKAERDCLAKVDVFGNPVACSRFMGGRAYDLITHGMTATDVDPAITQAVMRDGALALPSFDDAGGPYQGRRGEIRGLKVDTPAHRAALGQLYLAMVSDTCLNLIHADGPLLIEGVAARHPHLCALIASVRNTPVYVNDTSNGVTLGAGAIAYYHEATPPAPNYRRIDPLLKDEVLKYRSVWSQALLETGKAA